MTGTFEIGKVGLIVSGSPTWDDWYKFADTTLRVRTASQWALGDLLNYGESTYGSKYEQAINDLNYAYGTLRNFCALSAHFELSRRRDNLSISHHTAVMVLNDEIEEDRFLRMAIDRRLSREELRDLVREHLNKPKPPKKIDQFDADAADILSIVGNRLEGRSGQKLKVVLYLYESLVETVEG